MSFIKINSFRLFVGMVYGQSLELGLGFDFF